MSLVSTGGGVRTSVIKDAVDAAGHDPDDPGDSTHYWYRDIDMIVIDLRADGDE